MLTLVAASCGLFFTYPVKSKNLTTAEATDGAASFYMVRHPPI